MQVCCPRCGAQRLEAASFCVGCGDRFGQEVVGTPGYAASVAPVHPGNAALVAPVPPDLAGGGQPSNSVDPQVVYVPGDSSYGNWVPDQNPDALWAYYLAIASLIPLLGIVSGVLAVFKGVRGLRAYAANPSVRGKKHSLFGILVGGLLALVWVLLIGVPYAVIFHLGRW
jgi:hypothetical protein